MTFHGVGMDFFWNYTIPINLLLLLIIKNILLQQYFYTEREKSLQNLFKFQDVYTSAHLRWLVDWNCPHFPE